MASKTQIGLGVAGALGLAAVVVLATRKSAAASTPTLPTRCHLQAPQDFLIRQNYRAVPGGLAAAIAYRTEQYGHVPGFGDAALNPTTPPENAVKTTFFGLPVTLNHRVIKSLRCVENEIQRTCGATPYQPQSLSGLRTKNTYVGGEVSNHMYGIALDVDPLLNPCCGCIGKWASDPKCKMKVSSEFERMAMPACWVDAFERYGWYWLGHDELRDTMHFEFLGVPPDDIAHGEAWSALFF